jgi:DNA-binding NarL/FixJ family response regulator
MAAHEGDQPPRVLLGNLEPMVRLGMTAVLEEDGIDVIGAEMRSAPLVLMAGQLRPDALVLDLGQSTSRELGNRVRAASPETTIVFWARDEDVMEVDAPGAFERARVVSPVPDELRAVARRALSLRRSGA